MILSYNNNTAMLKILFIFSLIINFAVNTALSQVDIFQIDSEVKLSDICDSFPYQNFKILYIGRIDRNRKNVYYEVGSFDSLNYKTGEWFSFCNRKLCSIVSQPKSNNTIQYLSISRFNIDAIIQNLSFNNDYLIYYLKNRKLLLMVYINQFKESKIIHLYKINQKKASLLIKSTLVYFTDNNVFYRFSDY